MGIYVFRKQADKPNCASLRIKKASKQNQMCTEKKKKIITSHSIISNQSATKMREITYLEVIVLIYLRSYNMNLLYSNAF